MGVPAMILPTRYLRNERIFITMPTTDTSTAEGSITLNELREEILRDFKLVSLSREVSLLGRKEVLTGKAKFGIFGDGKELAQVCMAKQFRPGDWRSGYYRDQTFMFAIGELTVQQWFARLYAHADVRRNDLPDAEWVVAYISFQPETWGWMTT